MAMHWYGIAHVHLNSTVIRCTQTYNTNVVRLAMLLFTTLAMSVNFFTKTHIQYLYYIITQELLRYAPILKQM